MLGGTFSIPKRTEDSGYLPYVIQVKITTSAGDKHLATITYNGEGAMQPQHYILRIVEVLAITEKY